MLWCETAAEPPLAHEELAAFVCQLRARGIAAGVETGGVPGGLPRNAQYDLAPALRDGPPGAQDGLVLLGAESLGDAGLGRLRRFAGVGRALAFGHFPHRQGLIGARARLGYAIGRDPEVVDLATAPPAPGIGSEMPLFGVALPPARSGHPPAGEAAPVRLLLVGPELSQRAEAAAFAALALWPRITVAALTDGRAKSGWQKANGFAPPVYHFGEVLPAGLAARVDVAVVFAPVSRNYRLQCLIANLAVSGRVVIDGSEGHGLAAACDAALRGPFAVGALHAFLAETVLPNLAGLGRAAAASGFAARVRVGALGPLAAAGLIEPGLIEPGQIEPSASGAAPAPAGRRRAGAAAKAGAPGPGRVVFMPTNGVGLGHAQRCTLVAGALDRRLTTPVFAAFPSCLGLIKGYGFNAMPLVGRTTAHEQKFQNDLANYVRLRALIEGACGLVFDGGYVFDSVARTVIEAGVPGIWLRRGLWQAAQDNAVSLDREKVFARVIVPEEAFPELNLAYSHGAAVVPVGPVLRPLALDRRTRQGLREALAERYGGFERLVVTQLGAGVAADRSAQIQALCAMMERRAGVLHLVVLWPTGLAEPGWFGWRRSRVVRTHHAAVLAAAGDLCISAAGYNAFHDMLYNRLPAILLPQMSAFMDDQRARARAAAERGLAAVVEAHELMALERAVGRVLDEGEGAAQVARIAALSLPEPGTARAAALIEEVIHGEAGLDRAAVADRPARRR